MIVARLTGAALATALAFSYAGRSEAQSIGYAEAIDRLAVSCSADIDKFCKKVGLGGGKVQQCLNQNAAGVSPGCKGTISELRNLVQTRAQARAAVARVCDVDIRKFCPGVQQGDGNLMECFYKARRNVSPQCQKTVADAGYDVKLAPGAATDQVALDSRDMLDSLQSAESAATAISAASLRQLALQGMRDPSRANRMNRQPLSDQLGKLAQFTIAIRFDFDSSRIRPDSFRAVGLMADALNHPYLQGYRFLIVGHTDGKGKRDYNLNLSQQRADAIREALINPFGISAARIEAVGLGEEQFLNRANPEAAENRRVQLINIGK
jgi:outer membrane protein OmpA-like peptidoglycan-associated protein